MYKIMFFDLDGTLLNDKKEVLEENKKAIQIAKENGIEVAICSGRQKEFVKTYKQMAETGKYIICANGADIYDCENNDQIFACEVDKRLCINLYRLAEENNYLIRIDTPYARYINNSKYLRLGEILLEEDIESLVENNKIIQISLVAKEEIIDSILESLKQNLSQEYNAKVENWFRVNYFNEELCVINIVNKSVSKGNAISGLCKYLKIDLKEAIAFGDDLNDISMIKTVGMGVAMENAMPEIKEIANRIIGNNNKPSIAEFIYEMVEKNKKQ